MRGKKLGRFLGAFVAVALAVGATSQSAFAGGAHSGKTPPDFPGFNGSTIKLGVVTPTSSGVGGGGFALVYVAADKKTYVVDFRETAPDRARRDGPSRPPLR